MTTATFKTIRVQKLEIGKMVVAQIWSTHNRRDPKIIWVEEVTGKTIKAGMTVKTNLFTATTKDGILIAEINGKLCRITFGDYKPVRWVDTTRSTIEMEEERKIRREARKAKAQKA